MKNVRKITRSEMKTLTGGIAKGMVRCKDPDTCTLRWGWPTGSSSNCDEMSIICGDAPAVDPCDSSLCP
ncbi:hypothetical protein EG344_20490 [Chryseobacterium sp. G0162]|uniref:bacteriocin-like protein n=1 Tax=unclassified Chryseobacterium TaxID=2593645 RepID=UPI000F4F6CE3|nr:MULTISPECIES: hypothetical protein [unclassified Chryseobacterium]AZB11042.1 hypothetical protein EG344_20490 [Chryseobacterium sp. G0162]